MQKVICSQSVNANTCVKAVQKETQPMAVKKEKIWEVKADLEVEENENENE